MVTLRTGFGSPFGRKARIAVSVLGLDDKVKVEPASTQDDSDPLPKQNPLGKVPVLILDDGSTLFDSPVVLEYLYVDLSDSRFTITGAQNGYAFGLVRAGVNYHF